MSILCFACLLYSVDSGADERESEHSVTEVFEQTLIAGECREPGTVDRHLLQQSWYFDSALSDIGVAFGSHGFADYSTNPSTTAGYCIEGETIVAKYYSYEPSLSVNGEKVREEAHKDMRMIPPVRMHVELLTESKLILRWEGIDEKIELFR